MTIESPVIIFPPEALAQHIAALGKTGSGKTSTSKLAIEQVVAQGSRVCILDPVKSDWWGITSSADGKSPGLPFHILGGPRGHVPLHSGAGKAIGEIVASGQLKLSILDMAEFEPGGHSKFFADFAQTLLKRMRGVLYLVLEEAHVFAPKERSGIGKETMAIHWAKMIATAGRSKGIRMVVLTQRTQSLHNAILGSCDTLIAHRLTAPADQEPVLKWLKANVEKDLAKEIAGELSSLKTGTGWICSGEAKIFERRAFPRISTYDNSATPTDDSELEEVTTAAVDQDALRTIIGDAVEQAKDDDPEALRERIAELEEKLASKEGGEINTVDPVAVDLAREDGRRHGKAEGYRDGLRSLSPYLHRLMTIVETGEVVKTLVDDIKRAGDGGQTPPIIQEGSKGSLNDRPVTPRPAPPRAQQAGPARVSKTARQKVLDGLAWLEMVGISPASKVQLAIAADMSPTSGGYFAALSELKSALLIDYPAPGKIALTTPGRARAHRPDRPPTPADFHQSLKARLSQAQWKTLEGLIRVYPKPIEKGELAYLTHQSSTSGGFFGALSTLKALGLISYPAKGTIVAEPALFLESRA